jgi:flagellar biosynthetic protein FlhB
MAEENSAGERTESPSAKRRDDYRKKGQVAQSREVQTAAMFTLLLLFWIFAAPAFWEKIQEMMIAVWKASGDYALTTSGLMQLAYYLAASMGKALAPLFLVALLTGFFSSFLQIGWLFTTDPLIPDFAKLDPIAGMARFISKRSLVEVIKSLLKVGFIGWVAYKTVANEFASALLLAQLPVEETIRYLATTATLVMAKVAAIMIFLAALDYGFVRWEMEEKMKMTKQEQKEEMKETEGDPHVKSKIRSIQQQMARRRMMAAVPQADVVITNPTHFAVALQYKAGEMDAPVVLAKGQDLIAEKIREIAREHDIPLVENPPVARLLHSQVEVGQSIPDEMFKAVAEILAYVYSLKGMKR